MILILMKLTIYSNGYYVTSGILFIKSYWNFTNTINKWLFRFTKLKLKINKMAVEDKEANTQIDNNEAKQKIKMVTQVCQFK